MLEHPVLHNARDRCAHILNDFSPCFRLPKHSLVVVPNKGRLKMIFCDNFLVFFKKILDVRLEEESFLSFT